MLLSIILLEAFTRSNDTRTVYRMHVRDHDVCTSRAAYQHRGRFQFMILHNYIITVMLKLDNYDE